MNDRFNRKGAQPVWKSHEKTSAEKEAWLRPFEEEETLQMMDEESLAKARRYTEELCREDNVFALRLKGYACYGGNRLYECDWAAARDCMLRLRELADDAEYANTLGYIYYYGRCNGGEPEYEKAFPQFSYAAANGLFEAIYKLGDLYSHGYGCRKSEETAQNLYHMVYNETKKRFLRGFDASFADAALRLGKVFEYGIGIEANPAAAYCLYLEADYAAKIRAAHSDFFGDHSVAKRTGQALERVARNLPAEFFRDALWLDTPRPLVDFLEDGYRCELSFQKKEDGGAWVTGTRIGTRTCPDVEYRLANFGGLGVAIRCKKLSLKMEEPAEYEICDGGETAVFDYYERNTYDDQDEFYLGDKLVAWIKCPGYWADREILKG